MAGKYGCGRGGEGYIGHCKVESELCAYDYIFVCGNGKNVLNNLICQSDWDVNIKIGGIREYCECGILFLRFYNYTCINIFHFAFKY